MRRVRVIPVLLLQGRRLVKTERFGSPRYIGDPLNALRIFNAKEVDEIVVLDINASAAKGPDFDFVTQLVGECFMPLAYGGGIRRFEEAERLFSIGVEKIVLGSAAFESPELIAAISRTYGAQSVVVCIDVKKGLISGKQAYVRNARKRTGLSPLEMARKMEGFGAGEIILQSVDREGTGMGYDLPMIRQIAEQVNVPLVALGGAGNINDFRFAIAEGKASAVAAGSMFVFQGPHKAILISYPETAQLESLLSQA